MLRYTHLFTQKTHHHMETIMYKQHICKVEGNLRQSIMKLKTFKNIGLALSICRARALP